MVSVIRFRRLLRSRLFSILAAACALWGTASVVHQAEARRAGWGERVHVQRAVRDLAPGAVMSAKDLTSVELPRRAVPRGATTVPADLIGRSVTAHIHAGDLILAARTRSRVSATAARIAPGHRGVAVPTDERTPMVRIGDRVSVIDPMQPKMKPIDATVIDVGDDAVTVEAAPDDAGAIANAALRNSVAVFLRGN
jgi:Flp pilus assembly protein CpaB